MHTTTEMYSFEEEESALVRKRAADLESELEGALAMNTALNETIAQLQRQLRSAELKDRSISSPFLQVSGFIKS